MEISVAPLGYILIPLGVVLFFKSRRQLFWATVASIPFFYTYVVDLSVTLVQPYQYFGVLLILRNVLDLLLGRDRRPWTISTTTGAAFVFLLIAYLSLFMPAVLRDTIYVLPMDTPYQEYENVEPLRFGIANVFQVAYPTFMVLMFLCLAKEIRDSRDLKNIVRVQVVASFAVIGFGLFHQIGMMLGLDTVVESAFRVVTGFSEVPRIYSTYNMIGPLPRMFSLAGEPGYTGSYLIFVFAIMLGLGYNVVSGGWRMKRNKLLELGLLFGLIMTGSTTSYLGLVVLVIVLVALPKIFQLGKRGSRQRSALRFTTFFVATAVLVLLAAPIVLETSYVDYVYETHYSKLFLQEGSGSVRSITVRSGVEVFLQSPLLGVGFGSHRTSSLLTSLLSNVGLIGTVAFLWFNALVFRKGLRACRRSSNPALASLAYALLVGLATLLPVMLIAKSMIALIHGWYWLLMAMLVGSYRVFLQEATATVDEHPPVADGYPATAAGTS